MSAALLALCGLLAGVAAACERPAEPLAPRSADPASPEPPAATGAAQDGEPEDAAQADGALEPPPPRERVAGMRALAVTSRIVFAGAPDRPHVSETTFAFPQRARWVLTSDEQAAGRRVMRYRFGPYALGVDPGSPTSQLYAGAAAGLVILNIELRRAVLMWPDGFAWEADEGAPAERRAAVEGHGVLVATLPADGERPSAITSRGPDGEPFEALTDIAWAEPVDGRVWPSAFTLRSGGVPVWRETVAEVDPEARFVDAFFLPADRRAPTRREAPVARPTTVALPEEVERRIALAPELGWDAAIAAAARHRGALERELGRALDRRIALELDGAARPVAYLARLAEADDAPPPGWSRIAPRTGRSLRVERLAGVRADRLAELAEELPPEARPGAPYVRLDPGRPDRPVQLVLPLHMD